MTEEKPDFSKWKVLDLKEFLRDRNKPCPGLKADLVRLCNIYAQTPVVLPPAPVPDSSVSTEVFKSHLAWHEFSGPLNIPSGFNISVLIEYLSTCTLQLAVVAPKDSEDEETVFDSSTKKPSVKGRRMYASQKIQLLETAQLGGCGSIGFRCNMSASLGKECRYPRVALDSSGNIIEASCTCIQRADKRCCHVAALLFCIEDISLGKKPSINPPCTSQPQKWGKGSKTKKNPNPIHVNSYEKKRKTNQHYGWDPRPRHLQKTDQKEVDYFIKDLQIANLNTMWQQLLVFEYEDFELTHERKEILQKQVKDVVHHFKENLEPYIQDPKTNDQAVHISGTEEQSECELWKQARHLRVTASKIKDFANNPSSQASKHWETKNLDHIPAIRWGRQKEETARLEYEKATGTKTEKCGIFISKKFPYCGASPDATFDDGKGILEIKCPYIIRDKFPTDFSGLRKEQISVFPCAVKGSYLHLKRTHKYYYQVQFQLFVTGAEYCDFVV